ncbi:MAG TPA: hypothetical protein VFZ87_09790 [Gemmatimonadales bacterium]
MSLYMSETVAAFIGADGQEYQIDHPGRTTLELWGEFTVYRKGKPRQLAKFTIETARPRSRFSDLAVTTDELVERATAALSDAGVTGATGARVLANASGTSDQLTSTLERLSTTHWNAKQNV